jgi:hypothetical protein
MAKNTFATIGILAVLLFGIGMVSAAEGFDLTTVGLGDSSSNPVSGLNGTSHTVTVSLDHTNTTFGDVQVNWSGANALTLPANVIASEGVTQYTLSIKLPPTTQSSYRTLTATFVNPLNLSEELASTTTRIYYNGTAPTVTISGCTNSTANNYDPLATVDDGTCTYDVVPITPDFEFCNWNGTDGFVSGSDIIIKGFSDERLDNDDEWEWKPLDQVEIEIDVKNQGSDDEDYVIEIVFLDDQDNVIDLAEDDKDLEETISIDEGESETATITFEIDGDVDESNGYYMHIKVYQDGDEDEQCASVVKSEVEKVKITKERHDVLVKNVVEGPVNVEAGTQVIYEVRVSNLGKEDEDLVKVVVSNSELGILMTKEIEDLDEGDSEIISFIVDFPEEATEKVYKLRFSTMFDYDEDDDIFDKESDSGDDLLYPVTVLGGEHISPTISASLESGVEAKTGEELVIIASIINNGKEENFDITITGYEDWAELVSVSPRSLSLDEDEEGKVIITLIPKKDGVQTFDINAIFDGERHDRSVSVNIAEKKGIFEDVNKTVFYSVIGIAALLVLIFLTLIVRVSRKSKKVAQF